MSLLVVGSVALDTIETPFGKADDALGGSATFISAAASFFMKDISLVGVVGSDFPKEHIAFLAGKGINLDGLQIIEGGKTFRWSGRYHFDLNTRDTLDTQLNVFENFNPIIPEAAKNAEYVVLGNIHPTLQLQVLDQVKNPKLVIADTMNFWISGAYDQLVKTLARVDLLSINDSEARELAKEHNLVKAARKIMEMGPHTLIIKKGEHGALLFTSDSIFSAPAYPLEDIFDPTGAGDTFMGGFIGYLAKHDKLDLDHLKRAVIYGSTLASYSVEKFSLERLQNLTGKEIESRYRQFKNLSQFEE
ncbi:MAG: PfkB family carbohydrate kinase [Bacteroidetes bacterium]|nr:PfkB family carbohydrate kinase [Bacteroidota bacterium]